MGDTLETKRVITDESKRAYFDCNKCPAFCCSVYERVKVTRRDIKRLARHFGVPYETAERRYTKDFEGERVLKRVKDVIFEETCSFLNQETRGCSIYHARPTVCRGYPGRARCAYYDLLQFERKQQGNEGVVPVVRITFREVEEVVVADEDSAEVIEEWGDEKSLAAKKDPAVVEAEDARSARRRSTDAAQGQDSKRDPKLRDRGKRGSLRRS
jgi:Fe-S-cluster containining protein